MAYFDFNSGAYIEEIVSERWSRQMDEGPIWAVEAYKVKILDANLGSDLIYYLNLAYRL